MKNTSRVGTWQIKTAIIEYVFKLYKNQFQYELVFQCIMKNIYMTCREKEFIAMNVSYISISFGIIMTPFESIQDKGVGAQICCNKLSKS